MEYEYLHEQIPEEVAVEIRNLLEPKTAFK